MSSMLKRSILALTCITMSMVTSQLASAQQAESSKQVIILKFDTFDVETQVMDTFYFQLDQRINAHEDLKVAPGGDVSISEMIVAVGCDSPTPDCLEQLSGMLDADQLLFGSVQRSEDIHLFTIKLYDFESGEFVAQVEDQTVQGDYADLEKAIPTLIDSLLYGDVGQLQIDINGGDDAAVYFDGEKIGRGTTTLDNLPLGEHVIMVRSSSGDEISKTVLLRREEPSKLLFDFGGGALTDVAPTRARNKFAVPAWTMIGVGIVGLGFGGQQAFALRTAKQEDELWRDENTISFGDDQYALKDESLRGELDRRDARDDSLYTRAMIGTSVGAIAVVTGAVLLAVGKPSETEGTALRDHLKLDIGLGPGTKNVGVSVSF